MLEQLSVSVRRRAAALIRPNDDQSQASHAGVTNPVLERQAEIDSLRGVTPAAADVSECMCPGPCERDHANE